MEIGTAIKTLRKKKGYSQEQLGDKCGLSVNAISQIETNLTFPKESTVKNICTALEVSVAYLLASCISDADVSKEIKPVFDVLYNTLMTNLT